MSNFIKAKEKTSEYTKEGNAERNILETDSIEHIKELNE